MKYLIGTSGFSYDDWKGNFYPESIKKSDMLTFYAGKFNCIEINVTYYTIPPASSFEKMLMKTPAGFEFIVKVSQETTHKRDANEKSLQQLAEALKPLKEQNRLSGLLAQFPYSFANTEKNRAYLAKTRAYVDEVPLFVEFRNESWNKEAIYGFLKINNISYVNVDEPDLKGLLPAQNIVTTDTGYIRFHGRNKKDWWEGKGSARYTYEYSNDELQEWLIRVSDILKKSYKSYIFFNNHPKGNAPKNALAFEQMLQQYLAE